MLDRFVRLCEIPSPTGEERAVADAVLAELRELGVEVAEDGAAEPARAGAGNLIARVPGERDAWVMFACHLDTVPHDGPIEVVLDQGVFRSRGETILGADNKAAVDRADRARRAPRRSARRRSGSSSCSRSPRRTGCAGAKELDLGSLRSPFGFVLDHASPIGEVITAAPTYKRLVAEFEGIEAHAGIRPEDGRSAIAAAAAAIAAMKLGRLDDETTANVGVIAGGTASNVVAGPLPDRGRGAQPRRRAGQRDDRRDGRRLHLGGERARVRRRRRGDRDVPRLPAGLERRGRARRAGGARALRRRAARGRDRRRQRRERARRAPASSACCSPTGPRPTTRRRRASPRSGSSRCSRSARRSIDEAAGTMLKLRRGVVVDDRPADGRGRTSEAAPGLGGHARWSARCARATR